MPMLTQLCVGLSERLIIAMDGRFDLASEMAAGPAVCV